MCKYWQVFFFFFRSWPRIISIQLDYCTGCPNLCTMTSGKITLLLLKSKIKLSVFIVHCCICKKNTLTNLQLNHSVLFSHSVVSDSLRLHGSPHIRLPCPSPTPGACSSSCPLSQMMPSNHPILCRPLFLLPSIFSAPGSFPMIVLCIRWPKYWSFSFSIRPSNEY